MANENKKLLSRQELFEFVRERISHGKSGKKMETQLSQKMKIKDMESKLKRLEERQKLLQRLNQTEGMEYQNLVTDMEKMSWAVNTLRMAYERQWGVPSVKASEQKRETLHIRTSTQSQLEKKPAPKAKGR